LDKTITDANFIVIRNQIQLMIDQYRINVEKWVLDQFNDIPERSSDSAIVSLRLWMEKFITLKQQSEILQSIDRDQGMVSIVISKEILERIDSVRKFYGLENMEETIETLLDCIHRNPISIR